LFANYEGMKKCQDKIPPRGKLRLILALERQERVSPGLSLPFGQDALIEEVATANPKTVVVMQTRNPLSMP
jgi:hypothetical protein